MDKQMSFLQAEYANKKAYQAREAPEGDGNRWSMPGKFGGFAEAVTIYSARIPSSAKPHRKSWLRCRRSWMATGTMAVHGACQQNQQQPTAVNDRRKPF